MRIFRRPADDIDDDVLDRGLAAQAGLVAHMDTRRFSAFCAAEIVAAKSHIGTRLNTASPPIAIGFGMIVAAGYLLHALVGGGEIPPMSHTAAVLLDDAITNGPDQPCLPFLA